MNDIINYALAATLIAGLLISIFAYRIVGSSCTGTDAVRAGRGLLVLGAVLSAMAITQFMNGSDALLKHKGDLRQMFGGVCVLVSIVVIALASVVRSKCKDKDPKSTVKKDSDYLIGFGALGLAGSAAVLFV